MFADLTAIARGHAVATPDKVALTFPVGGLNTERVELTFSALHGRVSRLADTLRERFVPGTRALILLPSTPLFADAFLACLAADVIAVPLPMPTDENAMVRVRGVAEDCRPGVVLSATGVRDWLEALGDVRHLAPLWLDLDTIGYTDDVSPTVAETRRASGRGPDDVAFLQYTSGSTKAPRGVIVSHGALCHNERAIQRCFDVRPDSVVVSWLPLHHDMGLIGGLLQPLFTGARTQLMDPTTFIERPAVWLETIAATRADISGGPNFAYDLCVRKVTAEEKAGLDLSSWRVAFNGAAPVFASSLRAFSEAFAECGFDHRAHTPCYGLAESTLLVASSAADEPIRSDTFDIDALESGRVRSTPTTAPRGRELVAYQLLDHADVEIRRPESGELVAPDEIGELWVDSASNGSGYWSQQDDGGTFTPSPDDPAGPRRVRTGDLGFLHAGALHLTGRMKDLVIVRGRNLHPEDLEVDIAALDPALRPGCSAVFSIQPGDAATAPGGEEHLIVAQEVRPDTTTERLPELAALIRSALATGYGVQPHTVALLSPGAITKTSSGKVQRHLAKQRFQQGDLKPRWSDAVESRHGSQADLARLWEEESAAPGSSTPQQRLSRALCRYLELDLGVALAEPADPPAALGLDSLAAVRLQHGLSQALGVDLRPSEVIGARTVAELADAALAAQETGGAGEDAAADSGLATSSATTQPLLTQAQRALWFIQTTAPDSTAYNVTRAFQMTGPIDLDRLDESLRSVFSAHPMLRLRVATRDGAPVAEVTDRTLDLERLDASTWTEVEVAERIDALARQPFDLAEDTLMRVLLLGRDEGAVLVVSAHHIVCDHASLALFWAQLRAEYQGQPSPAPSYRHWPSEVESAAVAAGGERLEAFWNDRLAGQIPVLELPLSTQSRGWDGGSVDFTLPAGRLRSLARQRGLTVHNVLLATYQAFVHRLTSQRDLVVGVPVAGRTDVRVADQIGYLVNVLPQRSELVPGETFSDFAAATHTSMLSSLDHQELPFPLMARTLQLDRGTGAPPVFQTMFSYYTDAVPVAGMERNPLLGGDPGATQTWAGGVRVHSQPVRDRTSQNDLSLDVFDVGARLRATLQYDATLLDHDTVVAFAAAYQAFLGRVLDDPDAPLSSVALVSAEERADLLDWGCGHTASREDYLSVFERRAAAEPARVAVDDGTTQLAYGDLDERANGAAHRLVRAGVTPGSLVVVCAGRSAEFLVALLAIHKAGACYVPIAPHEAPARIRTMQETLGAGFVVGDEPGTRHVSDSLGPGAAKVCHLDLGDLVAAPSGYPPARRSRPDDIAYILHTSGSTGTPKAAMVTHRGMTNHLWQMIETFDVAEDDNVGQTATATFDISIWQFLAPLMVGGRLTVVEDARAMSPGLLLTDLVRTGVTIVEVVPVLVAALLDARLADSPHRLRSMISGGDELPWETARRWLDTLGHVELHNAYGPTECADDVTTYHVTEIGESAAAIPIGTPLTNTAVYLLDEHRQLVPRGLPGVLWVGGAGVGRGYLGAPAATAESFVPDPFTDRPGERMYCTGDLARVRVDGQLECLGRVDRQVKLRGLRIELGEIEIALRGVPGVASAVVAVQQTTRGESLVAHLVLRGQAAGDTDRPAPEPDGTATLLDPQAAQRFRVALVDRLPRHMMPTVYVTHRALPLLRNGKIDHRALVCPDLPSGGSLSSAHLADPVVRVVHQVWCELLVREEISELDSFFTLGGHSLLALQMLDRIRLQLGVELSIEDAFGAPVFGDFVDAVREAEPARPETVAIPRVARTRRPESASTGGGEA